MDGIPTVTLLDEAGGVAKWDGVEEPLPDGEGGDGIGNLEGDESFRKVLRTPLTRPAPRAVGLVPRLQHLDMEEALAG